MLRTVPNYKPVVSIIPGGCIQFLDFGFNLTALGKLACAFHEAPRPDADGACELHCLELDENTQEYLSQQDGRPVDPLYLIKAEKALEVYLDQWVPLPILRRIGIKPNGQPAFHPGPANWARGRLIALPEPDREGHTHRLTVALDTVSEARPPGDLYFALAPEDIQAGEEFLLADDARDNAQYARFRAVGRILRRFGKQASIARRDAALAPRIEHAGLPVETLHRAVDQWLCQT